MASEITIVVATPLLLPVRRLPSKVEPREGSGTGEHGYFAENSLGTFMS